MILSKIVWNSISGKASEPVHKKQKCKDHHAYTDEYGTRQACHICHTTDGVVRWVEYRRRPEYDAPEVKPEDTFEI